MHILWSECTGDEYDLKHWFILSADDADDVWTLKHDDWFKASFTG